MPFTPKIHFEEHPGWRLCRVSSGSNKLTRDPALVTCRTCQRLLKRAAESECTELETQP